jgi:hypothetical protein
MYDDDLSLPVLYYARESGRQGSATRGTRGQKSPKTIGGKSAGSAGRGTGAAGKAKTPAKVGSSRPAAAQFAEKGDFGIPADRATPADARYGRAKGPQQGTGPTRSGADGVRTVGVGHPTGPQGAGSGGDVDPDFVGVAGAGGIANSPPDPNLPDGPEMSDGSSNEFASGPPAKGENTRARPGRGKGSG